MIRTSTVFVVGAGASKELDFPIGEDLLAQISPVLDFETDAFGEPQRGDRQVWNALVQEVAGNNQKLNSFVKAALRVRDAVHLGLSIDNVIHQQNDDGLFEMCAKLAIARRILDAENSSSLRAHENNRRFTWPEVRGTWLGGFAQLLVQDVERKSIGGIFDNVSVISFNYDRTIRRFLPFALDSQFAIGNEVAAELSRQLQIFHPYGSLGPLELEGKSGTVSFGAKHVDLCSVARNIRTFTEQIEDKDHLADMRAKLSKANRIVFLGFGYLSQNMELLTVDTIGHASQVLGTSYGLSEPDNELVTNQLSEFFHENYRSHKNARLSPVKCAQFIRENFRTLTS